MRKEKEKGMAYDLHELELIGLQVKKLLQVHIEHEPGKHGRLKLEADLEEEDKDTSIHEALDGQVICLRGNKEGKREPIFYGVITGIEGRSMGKSYYVKVTAHTFSFLMDIKKKSRSFQDTSMTMGKLVSQITKEYGGQCQILFRDKALGEIVVQYDETDWEFIKRLLSSRNIPLVASEVREKLSLYAGVAQIPTKMEIDTVEGAEKLTSEKAYWSEKGVAVKDDEFICYRLRLNSRAILYSRVSYRKRSWIVSRLEYQTIGGRVYPLVTLRKKSGVREKSIYPMNLIGSALEGKILKVKGEKVQIHLAIDDGGTGKDCYWFPFSTPSASTDGSGWYYMPEEGDKVRVYFPTKHTKEVIAISAVSTYEAATRKKSRKTASPSATGENTAVPSASGSGGGESSLGGGAGSGSGAASNASGGGTAAQDQADKKGKKDSKDKMGDSSTKYLSTVDGHAVKLMKKGIEIICSGGAVKLELLKSGKINIYARDSIQLMTEEDITMKTKSILRASCKEAACFTSQMGGSLMLNEEGHIIFQGTEVHMN